MIVLLFLPILLTYATTVPPPQTLTGSKLRSVHVIFRHGDSEYVTPKLYPYSPDAPHDFNLHEQADLTTAGKMRSYKFGQYLRSRYSDFLGEEYQRDSVYAHSTYVERARASLLLVLAGLYPPGPQERWHPTLNWQPISIISSTGENDPLMWPIACPTYVKARERLESTPEFADKVQNLVDFLVNTRESKNFTKTHDLTVADLANFYRKMSNGIDADMWIPDWDILYPNMPSEIIRNAAVIRYYTQNFNFQLRRLNGGMLLKKIFNDLVDVGIDQKTPKINLYAGQEFNVVAILWALDAWEPIVPTYSSAVIIEFWEHNYSYYVKVLYHDGHTGETQARLIRGCSSKMCPFDEFVMLHSQVMPHDPNECYVCYDEEDEYDDDGEIKEDTDINGHKSGQHGNTVYDEEDAVFGETNEVEKSFKDVMNSFEL